MQNKLKLAAWILLLSLVASHAGAETAEDESNRDEGSLVIIGGGLRHAQNEVWGRIVELAGGQGSTIAVLPTASGDPQTNGNRAVDALRNAGADAVLIPLWITPGDNDYQRLVVDPELVAQIRSCKGVFFIGGSQERITRALGSSAGQKTPLLEAIWDVYRRGGVVAGTSAGAAIMSETMYRYSPSVLATLQTGVSYGRELAPGLGFLDGRWFVEQHCLARGRFGRSLVAMQTVGLKYGVGVEEDTAVVVRRSHQMSVMGYHGALVMDLSAATCNPQIKGFNIKNARLSYVDRGDAFNLATLELHPAEEKLTEQVLDPNAEDFRPARNDRIVNCDILGNGTLRDVMIKLIDNHQSEAIGLAFDSNAAVNGETSGFEFRFYREADTKGWFTGAGGDDAYTISNIHLDVRPVQVAGPLYRVASE